MWKTRLFGGTCRVTLATGSATWDVDFQGPGVIKESATKFSVCTEFGEAVYDKRCIVGWIIGQACGKEDGNEPESVENVPVRE